MRTVRRVALGTAALVLAAGGPAGADEAKTPVTAAMILSIVGAPVDAPTAGSRMSAFDESLKRPAPPVQDPSVGEVLPDGSVRYGKTIVTVKNPCPPGSGHWEPPPLPGRRAGR
jgi:hypothetical protein